MSTEPATPARGVFIAGSDTEVGKTRITLGLMAHLQSTGLAVTGMKPVASGSHRTSGGLRNADAEAILAQSSIPLPYSTVNPYAFEPAIAPHIAAVEAATDISLDVIERAFRVLTEGGAFCAVEGVGGWLVPLGDELSTADLVTRLQLPVILVVGIRLGCINHGLLSAQSILHHGSPLLGWVANVLNPETERIAGNVEALKRRIPAPLLGTVSWMPEWDPKAVARCLSGVDAVLNA